MWQPGWEGTLGKNGYMCVCGWVPSLSIWNYHNIVNWPCFSIKVFLKNKTNNKQTNKKPQTANRICLAASTLLSELGSAPLILRANLPVSRVFYSAWMEKWSLKEEKWNVAEFTKLLGGETENHHQACLASESLFSLPGSSEVFLFLNLSRPGNGVRYLNIETKEKVRHGNEFDVEMCLFFQVKCGNSVFRPGAQDQQISPTRLTLSALSKSLNSWSPHPHHSYSPPPQEVFPACSVTQSCLTLCNAMHCSPPGSSVHGILQARILQWAAMLSSRGSFQPRDQTQVSCLLHWQAGSLPLGPSGKPLPTKRLILSKSFLPCWKRDVEQWGVQNLPQMPTGLPGKVKAIYCVHPSIINIQGPSQRRTGLACVAESTPYTYF